MNISIYPKYIMIMFDKISSWKDDSTRGILKWFNMEVYVYIRGILSHGMMPIMVTLQHDFKATFLSVHSSDSMENSFNAFITISTCLGTSDDSWKLNSCFGVFFHKLFSCISPHKISIFWSEMGKYNYLWRRKKEFWSWPFRYLYSTSFETGK